MRHKVIIHTNGPFMKTGLAENGRILANYLEQTGKYDLIYYCSQVGERHSYLSCMPYKAYGAIPENPQEQAFLKKDGPMSATWRDACYGGYNLHKLIEKEKPSIYLGSDDVWAFQPHVYNAEWFKKINSILHVTVDSVPASKMAYEQAAITPNYFTWAKFAKNEMNKRGALNVKQIYGCADTKKFEPISPALKKQLRKEHNIDENCFIFIYLGRNQLRKEFGNAIQAFSVFKKNNPQVNAKLFFHTSFEEKDAGWDIPLLRDYFGLKKDDILTTYFCRQCKRWEVKPYSGPEQNCRFCGTRKSQFTCNIEYGVSDDEMKLIYGIADASISPFTSGGLEFHNVNSLLCGLPLASTNYSSGEDFCEQKFVYPIKWHARHEHNTNYIKATNDINSIANFMTQMVRKSKKDLEKISEQSVQWAKDTFSIEVIGKQWENVFDNMTPPEWSSISLLPPKKNENFPMPTDQDDMAFLKAMYLGFFQLSVQDDDKGLNDWMNSLRAGVPREEIYKFFVKKAIEENNKNAAPKDFSEFFDKNGRKKILFVMKESGGDLFICTALFKNLCKLYPDADLYVACDEKFHSILDGNPYIKKLLPFHPIMKQELAMMKYVDYYYYPALPTQEMLAYLSKDKIGLELT